MKKYKLYVFFYIYLFVVCLIFTVINFKLNKLNNYKFSTYFPQSYQIISSIKNEYDLMNENYLFITSEILESNLNKIDNLFLINKGSNDLIKEKSFVVNKDGLVGVVVKIFKNYSIVRSIYSDKTKIAVETNNCFGTLKVTNNKFIVSDLINCSDVESGDAIFTSKYNYSSSNILVGYVDKVENDLIYIKTAINPYKVKYVGIITNS